MERRLLHAIINPAMIASYVFGVWMLAQNPGLLHERFMHAKFVGVLGLQIVYFMLVSYRRAFAKDRNTHSDLFFRVLNEVPTVFMILIVISIIVH
jgi:putative membrane protein